jgi:hypothetical protein
MELTVVLDYYEAMETYSRIGLGELVDMVLVATPQRSPLSEAPEVSCHRLMISAASPVLKRQILKGAEVKTGKAKHTRNEWKRLVE